MENSEVATATYTYQKPQAKISFTENEYTVDLGKTVSVTATTEQTGTLTYSIEDGGTGSTIDSSTGLLTAGTTAGIAVVTASLAETDDYAATKATVNVYVEDPNKVEYTDVLNHDVFKLSNSYKDYKWTSTTTGITYDAYAYLIVNGTNKYMQFSKDKDDASGLITTDNPKGLKLKKVSIEWANSCNKKI